MSLGENFLEKTVNQNRKSKRGGQTYVNSVLKCRVEKSRELLGEYGRTNKYDRVGFSDDNEYDR